MTGIEKNKGPAGNRFPMKILAIALVLSMALFIGLGWYTWNSYRQFKIIQEQHFPLQKLTGIIIHLDEVLTMSARMAAATGDVQWEERYRSFESKLDGAIKETIRLAPEAYEGESAAQTDAANIQLVKMENQAFALVRQGQHEAASKLLSSTEYEQQKRIYAMGMENISAAIKGRVETHLHSQRRSVLLAVAAIVIALPVLIFSWIGVLRTVGRHLTERRQTDEKIQRNLQRITVLREINLAVTSTLDLHAMLKVLMEKIDILLPYTSVLVWLLDRESGQLERAACWNLDEEEWKGRRLSGTPSLVKAAIESKAPVVARNVQTDSRTLDSEFYRRHGLVSYLGVPLIVQGEVLGVLVFLTREEYQFADEEIGLLSALAGQTAMAIHNSQLHEQSKRQAVDLEKANEDLKRKEEIQALLKELSQDITKLAIDNLLTKLTNKVREVLKADVSDVHILVEEKWRLVGISGMDPNLLTSARTGTGRGRAGWILKHGRPLVIRDLAESDIPSGATLKNLSLRGYLGVPLPSRSGETIGILRALTYQPRDFSQEEVDLLLQMANGAGIALENARLLEEIKKQAEELEKANKVKDEFLRFVSHELRTPINAVLGYAAMIQDGLYGEVHGEQRETLGKIMSRSHDLLSMVNGLLEATRIEAGVVRLERDEVNLSEFLGEVRSTYDVRLDKELTLIWDYPSDLSTLETDRDKLKHILQNLINNAIKYTDKGTVTISARVIESSKQKAESSSGMLPTADRILPTGGGQWVEFRVTDTGIGIPKESLTSVFEMFRQVKGSRGGSRGGVGLGLHIVKKFTELIGGEIEVESAPGKGSTFTVALPCSLTWEK